MIKTDESALICDLAETYHIYDYKRLPISMVAVFAYGLSDDSRIKRKMSGQKVPMNTLLLAGIFDQINAFLYGMTKDAKTGNHRPKSLTDVLMGKTEKEKPKESSFSSSKEFNKKRQEILEKLRKEGKA